MPCLKFHRLGICDYADTVRDMRSWNDARSRNTPDQIWLLEHYPVYTQGVSCRDRPRDTSNTIPVVHSDRGGQITYHGPGQLVAYLMLDLRRLGFGVRRLVHVIEQSLMILLQDLKLDATTRPGAPGVYIQGEKIAALGLRVRSGCCYHGLSLNVDLDLQPFDHINPCGFDDLAVTSLEKQGVTLTVPEMADRLQAVLSQTLRREPTVDEEAVIN
ncbi:MAG: lipoyl(octanoyl) transferase LipB [Arenicellales bacterium]|nr:lipoyl(octanoyl) transferase LipB [Arenicellales bacterium]